MNKKLLVLISLIVAAAMLAACMPVGPAATASPAAAVTSAPAAAASPETPSPALTASSTPAPSSPEGTEAPRIREDTDIASPDDVRNAYITGLSMRTDGQTDIIFDFVDWFTGNDADEQFRMDHPGAKEEDIENAGVNEIGYIRNESEALHTYHTGPATKYFLPSEDDPAVNAEVSYDGFRDRMFPAVESGVDAFLKFVKISVDGDTIVKLEWNYLP